MKYLQTEAFLGEAECSTDAVKSSQLLEQRLAALHDELEQLPAGDESDRRFQLMLDAGYVLLDLDRRDEAWTQARQVFDSAVPAENWLRAVESADILYQAEQPDSIKALAHGIWLGVTFPVDPELSVAMLQHLIDETPDRSDGAAVAAAAARYLVDLRAEGKQREDLQFFTMQLIGDVARRHSQVEEQEIFDFWVERLQLDDPAKFLPRLAQVLDVLVDSNWWFDRDALRAKIPHD